MKHLLACYFCTTVLYISYLVGQTHGCFGWKKNINCQEYFKAQEGKCDDEVMIKRGEQQAEDMSAGLYKGVAADLSVDQVNFLLFPREIARVISALIEATGKAATKTQEGTLRQIRCHIDTLTKAMMSTIEVPNDDEKNFGGSEKDNSGDKDKNPTKMLSLVRLIFLDNNLKPAENYSKESYCWYHIPIVNTVSFVDPNATIDKINEWADKASMEAVKKVNPEMKDIKLARKPVARDPDVLKNDRAVIASSVYLHVQWADNLFRIKDTLVDQGFELEKSKHNKAMKVKVPLMRANGNFKLIDTKTYKAVSLPTKEGGSFIIALPKANSSLDKVEAEIVKSGRSLDAFVDTLKKAKSEDFDVLIPRLSIQIIHEWSTPSNKNLDVFSNSTGNGIRGDQVAVYQDTYLELNESDTSKEKSKNEKLEILEPAQDIDQKKLFKANRPFLFVFIVESHIVALGRVKDPYWCKNCELKWSYEEAGTDLSENAANVTSLTSSNTPEVATKISADDLSSSSENSTITEPQSSTTSHPPIMKDVTETEASNDILKMMFKTQ